MPLTQIEQYHRPADLDTAWQLLNDAGASARLLAGGTDLVAACPPEVTTLIDLADTGLAYVEVTDGGGLEIGSMTTFTDLLEHPAVAAFATGALAEMLGQVGSVLHRNSATLGGHLARARLSDAIPVLLVLDAAVVIHDGERRELGLADYLEAAPGPHVLTAVRLPGPASDSAAAFARQSRVAFDHAIVNGAVRIDTDGGPDGSLVAARVAIGQTAILGRRVPDAEEALTGQQLSAESVADAVAAVREIETRGDAVASAEYRRHLAGVLVERCLAAAGRRLAGGGS